MGTQARAPMPPCHFEPKMDMLGRFSIIQDCNLDPRVLLLLLLECVERVGPFSTLLY
jgi:hypothetical protein